MGSELAQPRWQRGVNLQLNSIPGYHKNSDRTGAGSLVSNEMKIVAMPLIPSTLLDISAFERYRGSALRCNLTYAKYSQVTWKWWCKRNGAHFIAISNRLGGPEYSHVLPTFQKWLAPEYLIKEYGRDCKIAVVDADTMIRWDTPDFFSLAGQNFAAVACAGIPDGYRGISRARRAPPNSRSAASRASGRAELRRRSRRAPRVPQVRSRRTLADSRAGR